MARMSSSAMQTCLAGPATPQQVIAAWRKMVRSERAPNVLASTGVVWQAAARYFTWHCHQGHLPQEG
jgi:hypothetical protein